MMADAIVGILAFCCVVCCVKNYDGRVRVECLKKNRAVVLLVCSYGVQSRTEHS
jgi:hypothetical protein